MKKALLLACAALALTSLVKAQSWQWGKRMGSSDNSVNNYFETLIDMASDAKGNVYTLSRVYQNNLNADGHAKTGYGGQDIMISSFRCDGTYRWTKVIGAASSTDLPKAIRTDGTNGVYVLGYINVSPGNATNGYFDADTTIGTTYRSNFIVKYDTSGNYKWLRRPQPDTATSWNDSYNRFVDMDADASGNLYILSLLTPGAFASGSFNVINSGVYALKYNSSGQCLGGTPLAITTDNLSGGLTGMRIRFNSSTSQYFVSGGFETTGSLSIGGSGPLSNYTGYVAALNSTGTFGWLKTTSNGGAAIYDRVKFDNANNAFVCGISGNGGTFNGVTFSNTLNTSAGLPFVTKLNNTNGSSLWTTYAKTKSFAFARAIEFTNGKVLFGGEFADKVVFTTDSFTNSAMATGRDCFVVQLDASSGAVQKTATIIGGGAEDLLNNIAADKSGNFFIGGHFESSLTVGTTTLSNAGGETDIYVAKYGIANCNCTLPSPNFTSGAASGKTVQYTYNGTTTSIDSLVWDFGDGTKQKVTTGFTTPLSHTFTANGKYNVCVTAYNSTCGSNQYCKQTPLAVGSVSALENVQVYPNPASDRLTIEGAQGATAILYNSIGQQAAQLHVNTDKQVMDIAPLPAGSYILQLTDAKGNRGNLHIVKE